MIVTLVVVKGDDEGKLLHLADGETKVVGRSSRSDIILRDAGVSRQHSRIRISGGTLYVSDLQSKNGTVVNGNQISGEVVLTDGDMVDLADTRLQVQVKSPGTPHRPAAPAAPPAAAEAVEAAPIEINPDAQPQLAPAPDESRESLMGAFEGYLEPNVPAPSHPEAAAAGYAEPAPPAPESFIGATIGGCRVEEWIGEDPVSRIYRGTQLSVDRSVALKLSLPTITRDSQAVEGFIRAGRAAGRLSHPHVVQVYDAGEAEGVYFIALELVDGKSVPELLRARGRHKGLPLNQAIEIAEQIAGALEYAHGRLIIHGHITPREILVTSHGIAKLAGLGFAQGLGDASMWGPLTQEEHLDRIYFSAPEVLSAPNSAAEPSDIYSLAAVLFVMVTGRMPFKGKTEAEILQRVQRGEHESLMRLQARVPEALGHIVERAMSPIPEQRHSRASELQAELKWVRENLRLRP